MPSKVLVGEAVRQLQGGIWRTVPWSIASGAAAYRQPALDSRFGEGLFAVTLNGMAVHLEPALCLSILLSQRLNSMKRQTGLSL